MLGDFEPVFCRHRILYGFEFGGKEFNDLAALRADHVIVMLVFVVVLVMGATIAETNFARETGIR